MNEVTSLPAYDRANPGRSRRRRQLTILIACILIAISLWFLRALENDYITNVDHPVSYVNLPEKMITLNPLPQKISLEVKGLGFSVLRHNWNFSKTPLVIDFKKLKSVSAKRQKGFVEYLPMNQYFGEFSTQLKDLKVLAIIPDTLVFRLGLRKAKNVKVIPIFLYEPGTSYIPDSLVRVIPDSVEISGPDLLLDTLRSIRTIPIKISKTGGHNSRSVALEDIHKLVKTKPAKVTVLTAKKN